jgi:uncharacterized OB-fold protein
MSPTDKNEERSLMVGRDEAGPYLIGGKCASCGAVFFPQQSICPRCTKREITETPLSRKGTLYTYTEVFQKPPDYEGPVPYLIGRVLLPEGVFILSQLDGCKEDLHIDLEMDLVVEDRPLEEDSTMYKFRPAIPGPKA